MNTSSSVSVSFWHPTILTYGEEENYIWHRRHIRPDDHSLWVWVISVVMITQHRHLFVSPGEVIYYRVSGTALKSHLGKYDQTYQSQGCNVFMHVSPQQRRRGTEEEKDNKEEVKKISLKLFALRAIYLTSCYLKLPWGILSCTISESFRKFSYCKIVKCSIC